MRLKQILMLAALAAVACGSDFNNLVFGGSGGAAAVAAASSTGIGGTGVGGAVAVSVVSTGTGGAGGMGGTPVVPGCPQGQGSPMVAVPWPNAAGWFCVDSFETNRKEYVAFLAANPDGSASIANQSPVCSWNKSFTPSDCGGNQTWPPPPGDFMGYPNDRYPVGCVDFCDAAGYCAWRGKRLCKAGQVFADPKTNEWFTACTKGGQRAFPYGNTYSAVCEHKPSPNPADLKDACEGGYAGLFNLVGNTAEWLSCTGAQGATDPCFAAGGSYASSSEQLACASTATLSRSTNTTYGVGIRCCADATVN